STTIPGFDLSSVCRQPFKQPRFRYGESVLCENGICCSTANKSTRESHRSNRESPAPARERTNPTCASKSHKESLMKDKLEFVRLPILLFVIFFIGRLVLGAGMGVSKGSYDLSNRL